MLVIPSWGVMTKSNQPVAAHICSSGSWDNDYCFLMTYWNHLVFPWTSNILHRPADKPMWSQFVWCTIPWSMIGSGRIKLWAMQGLLHKFPNNWRHVPACLHEGWIGLSTFILLQWRFFFFFSLPKPMVESWLPQGLASTQWLPNVCFWYVHLSHPALPEQTAFYQVDTLLGACTSCLNPLFCSECKWMW